MLGPQHALAARDRRNSLQEDAVKADHIDILIIGAGLSGIGAACQLQEKCPKRRFVILEARERIGGTWDFFRYPGVRSDSDMFTLSYSFRPWTGAKSIVDGQSILNYVRATAREHGIDGKIRTNHRVKHASWSSAEGRWTVEVERGASGEFAYLSCNFLIVCSGYYSYAAGYTPEFPGIGRFKGRVIHPQDWSEDVDYANKRVVVIGSGATAITLVPELAKSAAHVTMLQRSPTYVVSWPDEDSIANALFRWLPPKAACSVTRWKNVLAGIYFYRVCKRDPDRAKAMILEGVRTELGPDYDVATHFTPRYNPWDQRLCLAPNGDFFHSIKNAGTTIVTDEIETFTEGGLKLRSGRELAADLVVTATGLNMQVLGGAGIDVDGKPTDPAATLSYKGALFSDIPNLASVFGYTNASWTLKADIICGYICRLLNHMEKHGYGQCTPRNSDPTLARLPAVDFSSGYFQRAMDKLPRQGSRKPWRIHQNYLQDLIALSLAPVADDVLEFRSAPQKNPTRVGASRPMQSAGAP
jgi:cation diffusion facilitator CzcD-associated flavoprotein CzcO